MKRKAFTLLELLIVIGIIALIAKFTYPRFVIAVERSKKAEAVSMLHALRGAQKRYFLEQTPNHYTNSLDDLDVEIDTPRYFSNPTAIQSPPLVLAVTQRNSYHYNLSTTTYLLYIGEDGIIRCFSNDPDLCGKLGF